MAGIVMDLFRGEAYTRAMTIGLLSALSLLVTLHQAPSSTAMDDGIIAGHVVDAASEAPVVGASVCGSRWSQRQHSLSQAWYSMKAAGRLAARWSH